jgi:DNA-binding MarR family transcriptional regulator
MSTTTTTTTPTTASDDARLRALIRICDYFQEAAGPTVPLAVVEAFLLVALYEGASLKDLCRLSGAAQSTLSRHLLDLADRNRKGEPGLKLVGWRHPPEELRRKEYFLTAKGRALRDRLLAPGPPRGASAVPMVAMDIDPDAPVVGYRSTTAPRRRRQRRTGGRLPSSGRPG